MATVSKGRTFVSGETVTPAKLNELVDNATVTGIVDADVSSSAAIALSKLATGALPTAITVATANILDANVTPTKLSQPYTLATAQNSTSGTSIDFTGIPSWAKRITVMFNGVSTNGSSNPLIQVGSGSVQTSGYASGSRDTTTTTAGSGSGSSQGFILSSSFAAHVLSGHIVLTLVSSNTWCSSHNIYLTVAGNHYSITGAGISPSLSGALDRIRITTVNGADTFDAGSINIAYEG